MKMEASNSKTKQYIFIAAALAIAIIVCGVIFLNVPIIKKVFEKKDALEAKKLEFGLLEDQANQSSRYIGLVESFSEDRKLIESATIKADSVVGFIEEIEGIARLVGVQIEITHKETGKKKKTSNVPVSAAEDESPAGSGLGASPGSSGEDSGGETVSLNIVILGSYKQFLEFYYRLENMPYIFSIDSFGIKKTAGNPSVFEGFAQLGETEKLGIITGEIGISFTAK